jgi:hypothetical protein
LDKIIFDTSSNIILEINLLRCKARYIFNLIVIRKVNNMILQITTELGMKLGIALFAALSAILFLFGSDMLARFLNADSKTRKDAVFILFLMISLGILGYAVYMILLIFIEYLGFDAAWLRTLRFYLIVLILGPFALIAEEIITEKKKKMAIMKIVLAIGAVFGLILVILDAAGVTRPWGLDYVLYAIIGIFALYGFAGIFIIFMKKMKPQAEIKKRMQMGLSALIFALVGEGMQLADQKEYGALFVWGILIEMLGILIIRYFFMGIPSYDEFEWKSGCIELHVIMAETGISLYYKKFAQINPAELKGDIKVTASLPEDEHRPNTDLVGGGMIGIKGMLSEISGDRGKLEHIQIGEKSLIFKQGEVLLLLLLTNKNLGVYYSILEECLQSIESAHPNLLNFNGDTRSLNIEPLVNNSFNVEPEEAKKPAPAAEKKE